jgi:HEAT repeat protein
VATLALGKTGHDPAVPVLIGWLKAGPIRGEAALALGGCAGTKAKEAVDALLQSLVDPEDGWVRFCSYLALKHISKQDYFTDYIFGSPELIYAARAKYKEWFSKNGYAK